MIETKLLRDEKRLVLLTPIQIHKIRELQKHGTVCGVAAIVWLGNPGEWKIYLHSDPTKTRIDDTFIQLFRMRGEEWPIDDMIKAVKYQISREVMP